MHRSRSLWAIKGLGVILSSEKLALLVDGLSLHHTAKALNFSIDFKRLLAEFGTLGVLVRAYYYTIIAEEFQTTRPLIDGLDYNGFTVRTNSVKEFDDGQGRRKFKRNNGVELVVDAIEVAKRVEHIVLFYGDSNFCSRVKALQRLGLRVTLVSPRTKHGRIRMHGGAHGTGALKGPRNGMWRHGLYSQETIELKRAVRRMQAVAEGG